MMHTTLRSTLRVRIENRAASPGQNGQTKAEFSKIASIGLSGNFIRQLFALFGLFGQHYDEELRERNIYVNFIDPVIHQT